VTFKIYEMWVEKISWNELVRYEQALHSQERQELPTCIKIWGYLDWSHVPRHGLPKYVNKGKIGGMKRRGRRTKQLPDDLMKTEDNAA
jgi:hypothetical protein